MMMEGTHTDTTGGNRRTTTENLVNKLTTERNDMLVSFCRLAGVEPFHDPNNFKEWRQRLDDFCQILVDYLAAGHFGLYQRIIDGKERRGNVRELAEKLYPGIAATTESALEFNDKYESASLLPENSDFNHDLSELGEVLANRIEIEDQLLSALT